MELALPAHSLRPGPASRPADRLARAQEVNTLLVAYHPSCHLLLGAVQFSFAQGRDPVERAEPQTIQGETIA